MGIAGLWSSWKSPKADIVHSFTMLTINAAHHSLMRQFHKPTDEKRMVVILEEGQYDAWLQAGVAQSQGFLRLYPSELLVAIAPLAPHPSLF